MKLSHQIISLFILAIPVACIAWTVTHEEIFREVKNYCTRCSIEKKSILVRKFFYLFTCEYCFSHYVTAVILLITGFQLLFMGWVGYFISFFSIVWIANVYMSLYSFLRMGIKQEITEINLLNKDLESK